MSGHFDWSVFLKTCQKVDANAWSQMMRDNSEQMLDFVLKHHTVSKTYYDNVLKTSREKKQTELAVWLCERAGVPTDRYLGLNDIEPFEKLLDVSINVVSFRVGNKFVRVTRDQEKPRLYLYHVDSENENTGTELPAYKDSLRHSTFVILV